MAEDQPQLRKRTIGEIMGHATLFRNQGLKPFVALAASVEDDEWELLYTILLNYALGQSAKVRPGDKN